MLDECSRELLARYQAGEEAAADAIFNRYVHRLIGLTRSRLSRKLARRLDPEDIVQSAYRSFFRAARAGEFEVSEGRKLWSLLATITLHKLYRQVRKQRAAKVNVNQDQSVASLDGIPLEQVAGDPTPFEANEIAEILQDVMASLTPLQRQMLQMHLQSHSVHEIAKETRRAVRTVKRLLEKVERMLEQRLKGVEDT